MSHGIAPTEHDISIARQGVMTQVHTHCGALDVKALTAFIESQVEVIAGQTAYIRYLHSILHPDL